MRLINATSSHSELVRNQLRDTGAKLVETYPTGNTGAIFTRVPKYYELLIPDKHHAIKDSETEIIREFLLKHKINKSVVQLDRLGTLHTASLAGTSFPTAH